MALNGFSQSNGSTVSHHVVFTPAIRERYVSLAFNSFIAKPVTSSTSQRRRCSDDGTYTVDFSLSQHGPGDACRLVSQRDCSNLQRSPYGTSMPGAGAVHHIISGPKAGAARYVYRANYSINSSARASSVGEMVMPSALAVLRLMTSSNFVGCSTGSSPGLAPLRILST